MLMRFEPFSEFDRITEQLKSERRAWQIPVDAYRRDDEFKLLLDLPGTDPDSIEVTVDNDVLTVRGTRTWLRFDDDQIAITERPKGEFSRQLFLAESLDRNKITASYEDGVLTLTIPVIAQAKPRKVKIVHAKVAAKPVAPVLTSV
ncbi:MAG: Hsp20/alpha crystallin family protein [Acidimicrobiales bacterium]